MKTNLRILAWEKSNPHESIAKSANSVERFIPMRCVDSHFSPFYRARILANACLVQTPNSLMVFARPSTERRKGIRIGSALVWGRRASGECALGVGFFECGMIFLENGLRRNVCWI
jgi:hypothetical protein